MNIKISILFLFLLLTIGLSAQYRIEGEVFDQSSGQPMPGAYVWLFPDSTATVCDENGFFVLYAIEGRDSVQLKASFVGRNDVLFKQILQKNQKNYHVHLYMNELDCEKCKIADIVLVEETALARRNSQSSALFNGSFFEENLQGNFSKSLEKIAGINTINIGVGIAKPVIRGLSGNRIIVNQNGIGQQGQQWGNDHGLEIDALGVDRMELIKGPSSLLYGSDGLGGVINILPERIAAHNSLKASLIGIYKSNNGHWGTSAHISSNYHNWFVQLRYSRQEAGDYRIPADSFIYNGFVLPIFNHQLKNTATKEENVHFSFGTLQKWGVLRFTGSHFGFRSGIFSGAMGIPRAYDLQPDGNNRDIDLPSQSVSHLKFIFNADFLLPDKGQLKFDAGYQRNLRREFSFAHAHNRTENGSAVSDLALELLLQTFSANLRHQQPISEKLTLKSGTSFQYQQNERAGFDFLLPDFKTLRAGIYGIIEFYKNSRFKADGGFRIDIANNSSDFYEQPIIVNGSELLSLGSPALNQFFLNYAAAAGIWYAVIPEKWAFRAHLGRSFRVPHPVETVSNGVHHGTFRHEQGTADLLTEKGLQLDLSSDLTFEKGEVFLSIFANYFDNYIYLGPTARFSPLPDAGQLFKYQQTDAFFTGGELSWNYKLLSFLQLKQAYDFVWNINLETFLGLPFTPPASILTELRLEMPKSWKVLNKGYFELGYRYRFAQNRVDRNEKTTPVYHLIDLGLGTTFRFKKQDIIVGIQVQNLLNTSYLQHLSRYRLLNLPEQGRNLVLMLKIPFEISLDK